MDEKQFQTQLQQILESIKGLPVDGKTKKELVQQAEQAKGRFDQNKETIARLTESMDLLRVSVKYLIFDLEATRRENKTLRSLLDSQMGDTDVDGD